MVRFFFRFFFFHSTSDIPLQNSEIWTEALCSGEIQVSQWFARHQCRIP
jgi:hypothetical protein